MGVFTLVYLLLFGSSLLLALAVTPLAGRLADRMHLVDQPGKERFSRKVTPYGGGIAIFLCLILVLVAAYLLVVFLRAYATPEPPATWPEWARKMLMVLQPYLRGLVWGRTLFKISAVLGGGLVVFLLGMVDDARGIMPGPKLLVQAAAAMLLVAADVRITFFVHNQVVSAVLTVLWVVLLTNAFNLLDNMDGVSAGVALVASSLFFVVAVQADQFFVAAFLAVFSGVLLGFLRYNFSPARLFMGDAGSLFIGFILAGLTISGTYYSGRGNLAAICMPVLILGVPLFDTASVMWIRWQEGRPFFQGDTNHFSHRLVRLGLSVREACLTIYLLAMVLGGAATLLRDMGNQGTVLVMLVAVGVIALIVLLENAAGRRERGNQKSKGEN